MLKKENGIAAKSANEIDNTNIINGIGEAINETLNWLGSEVEDHTIHTNKGNIVIQSSLDYCYCDDGTKFHLTFYTSAWDFADDDDTEYPCGSFCYSFLDSEYSGAETLDFYDIYNEIKDWVDNLMAGKGKTVVINDTNR